MTDLITSPPKPNPIATRLPITCGDCVFIRHMRLPNATAPCGLMGCPTSRAPCARFTPNVFSAAVGEAMDSKGLRKALRSVPDAALASVAMAVAHTAQLRAVGLSLGQLVYFNAAGTNHLRDYVANYYRGRVMHLDKDGNIYLGGKGVTAIINPESILSEQEWKSKRSHLITMGKIVDEASPFTWERKDEKLLSKKAYRPSWLDKRIIEYRAKYLEAKATRQTHDYDSATPIKRGRGRPKGSGKTVKSIDVSANV